MIEAKREYSRAFDLKIKMLMVRVSQTSAAEKLGVSRSWLNRVLNEEAKSEPLLDKLEIYLQESVPASKN